MLMMLSWLQNETFMLFLSLSLSLFLSSFFCNQNTSKIYAYVSADKAEKILIEKKKSENLIHSKDLNA